MCFFQITSKHILVNDALIKIYCVFLYKHLYIFGLLTNCVHTQQASQDKKSLDVGANLFVGNLDPVSLHLTHH